MLAANILKILIMSKHIQLFLKDSLAFYYAFSFARMTVILR